jgi:hypothetical protein
LVITSCRLSEALALTADRGDLAAGVLVIESLKKRRTGIYRAVPVPPALLDALDLVHCIREHQARRGKGRGERLWPWSRMTGWRAVHAVMQAARLDGPQASPKGLRHGFGVAAVSAGIPLNLVQKWLGHAQLTTTAIYADAVGTEETDIARRMWGSGRHGAVPARGLRRSRRRQGAVRRPSVTGPPVSIPFEPILSPVSCFCPGSARGCHLMGFDEDRPANLGRAVVLRAAPVLTRLRGFALLWRYFGAAGCR